MDVSDLTEDQAKAILDILAKRMGLDYCTIKFNRFCMVHHYLVFFTALDSPYKALNNYNSYIKVLEVIMSRRREDNSATIYIPGTTIFHATKCPSLEELLIQLDIA